ncbi:hypothetical protein [Yersinia phage MHG19]|nr:hypothetical protein [Yersinia phage MHG19]
MPMYEYHCAECGDKIEKIRKISERDEPIKCVSPSCEGIAYRNKVVAPAVHYKGFANNEY